MTASFVEKWPPLYAAWRFVTTAVSGGLPRDSDVDHDVCDRHVVAVACLLDDALLEPVRPAGRVRRDDDLVGGKLAERVLQGLEGIAVADLAAGADPCRREPCEARIQPRLRLHPRGVLVRRPRAHPGVERRAHEEHLLV